MKASNAESADKSAVCSKYDARLITEFQKTILSWYRENRRAFPWRETTDPYRILVSEIMLQQTQTERVLHKYTEFLEAFPTASVLSEAPLADVLEKWSGLGYNRRARFLQKACQAVENENGGVFPHTPSELEKLPGIGPYTARAVACFAFGGGYPEAVEPFIETNIRSVFIFFFFNGNSPLVQRGAVKGTARQQDAENEAIKQKSSENKPVTRVSGDASIIPEKAGERVSDAHILPLVADSMPSTDVCSAREWFYALMDYGAMLKKKTVNPSRKSAGYTKQSRFQGSVRQARGVILRQLVKNKECALSLSQIQKIEYIDIERLEKAAELLCAENLIIRDGDMYRIV